MSERSCLAVSLGLWQDRPPLEGLETAALADELGYSELWIGEMATFDAFALATAVGMRTRRIPLTVGPLAVALRSPVGMAMGIASVAALTGRPVHLALGASSDVVVEHWHGRDRRGGAARLRETAAAVRGLLAGERVVYEGSLVRTHGYRLRLPAPSGSLTIAAFGPRAIAAAVEADRMVINLCTPALAASLRSRLSTAAAAAGRPVPRLALWAPAGVDPEAAGYAQAAQALVGYLAAPGYGEMFAQAGFAELVAFARTRPHPRELLARMPPALCEAVGLLGDRDTCRRRAAEYRDAGVDDLVLVPLTAGDPAGARTLTALRDLV
jgi:probable F420-dependent oxidoreductase